MSVKQLYTEDKLEYQFLPTRGNQVQFRLKAANDGHIALTTEPQEGEPMFEVFIGGWSNAKSVIRKNRTKPEVAEAETPSILSADELRGFWIRWSDNLLTVGKEGFHNPMLSYEDPELSNIRFIGFCTGWGATGEWHLEDEASRPSAPVDPISSHGPVGVWCQADGGILPPDALEGGNDIDGVLYVGRANHEGALIPGKVNPQHGVCYVAWGGEEHGKAQYEVLCNSSSMWVPTSGENIPPNAVPGGQTEEGETLFVGRVNHEGTVTIGKVQPSHKCLYIPFAGQEVSFPEFEILVS
ncbi:uncharacterized protein LOC127283912 isoform X2 [Leptopilina boulardi]|uniref:uncharacterized protein LOC127283912 isoform X2 n=1 Tax=Leptopilina boulardi TaxID=63433 RepID=UPI0021F58A99|nr:uncharacterized protein LOC127283912 isoform X2 [Leptopilina boulardi]